MRHLILVLVTILTLSSCNMFSSSDKYDGNYREACRNLDFEAAHKILDKITTKDSWWDGHTPKEDIIAATDYIFNAETLYLTSQNTEEANNRVVYLLSELPIEGRADPEGTKIELNDDMSDDGGFTAYRSYVNRFNSKFLSILNTAISVGNKEVAEKIIPMIKEDANIVKKMEKKIYGRRSNGEIHYTESEESYVHYTTDSKDKAKRLYEKAVQEGKFK